MPLGLEEEVLAGERPLGLIHRMELMEPHDHHRKMALGPVDGALEQGLIDRTETLEQHYHHRKMALGPIGGALVQELIGMIVLGLVDGTEPLKEHGHLRILRTHQLGLHDLRRKRPLEPVDGVQQERVDGVP